MKNLGLIIALLVIVLIALFLFFSNRGQPSQDNEPVPPVEQEAAEVAQTATATQPPATIAAPPATPTNEPAATVPPPEGNEVIAKTLVTLNLRQGPDTTYGTVGSIPADDEVVVVGRNADSSWLVVNSNDGQAWMIGRADFVSVDAAAVATLPIIEAATPYDANHPRVKQVLEEIPMVVLHGGSHTCASKGGLNHLLDNVVNGNVIGPHSGDFVYGQDNILFEYSAGEIRMLKENPVARFDNDEKYVSFTRAMQLFENDEIVWTGRIGEWPARGVPGCDLSAQP